MTKYVPKQKEVEVVQFSEIAEFAKNDPKATQWHFDVDGLVFTHENDSCWIVGSYDGTTKFVGSCYFTPFDILVKFADRYEIVKRDVFERQYMNAIFEKQ
jgi:hypothetical protein